MSFTYSAGGVMPLPRLAWTFDGTTTDYVTGLAGAVRGTVNYGSGKFNKSIIIINDVTSATSSNAVSWSYSLNIDNGITIAFWVKVYQIGANTQTLLQYAGSGAGGSSTIIFSMNGTVGTVAMWYKDASYHTITSSALTINTWYHLCLSVGSGSVAAYLNGVSQGTTTYTPSGQTLTGFNFGAYGANTPATGEYDDLRIYNTALTAAQVQAVYQAQGMPSRGVQTNTLVPIASMIGQTFSPVNTRTPLPDTSVAGQISITSAATNYTTQGPMALTPATTGFSFSIIYKINTPVSNASGMVCFLSSAGDCLQLGMAFGSTSLVARKFIATTAYAYASTTVTSSGVVYYATVVVNTTGYVYLYLNGSLVSSGTTDTNKLPNTTYTCYLGANRFLNLGDYTIYDFFAVNATLSASQVSQLYQNQLANINYNPGNTFNWSPTWFKRTL